MAKRLDGEDSVNVGLAKNPALSGAELRSMRSERCCLRRLLRRNVEQEIHAGFSVHIRQRRIIPGEHGRGLEHALHAMSRAERLVPP